MSLSKVIVAAAGSGKTERIVKEALGKPSAQRVLITTYTVDNLEEIRRRIVKVAGFVPPNITLLGWFSFLLKHGIKPFQHPTLRANYVQGLHFEKRPGFPRKTDVYRYYVDARGAVYREVAAEFALLLDDTMTGEVFGRINSIFDHVYVDEVQDMSARDFEFIERLIARGMPVMMVGDPRQGTFSTTNSRTNKKLTKSNVGSWFELMAAQGLVEIEPLDHSYRCNQVICDYGDLLYDGHGFASTHSLQEVVTEHDGVYILHPDDVSIYTSTYAVQPLRYWARTDTGGVEARNFGEVKGLTFDRVLIYPTGSIGDFVKTQKSLAPDTRAKFYVAVTRAKHSVAIILESCGSSDIPVWKPEPDSDLN